MTDGEYLRLNNMSANIDLVESPWKENLRETLSAFNLTLICCSKKPYIHIFFDRFTRRDIIQRQSKIQMQ
jgi:hypothetical protein